LDKHRPYGINDRYIQGYNMKTHFDRELTRLKRDILSLGALVETAVDRAVEAFSERDTTLAQEVIETEKEINLREVEFEEECLKIMALHQPVAGDLRRIIAYLKINNDLEKVGDLAVTIARKAIFISTYKEHIKIDFEYPVMAEMSKKLLRESLDALVNHDVKQAHKVLKQDKELNKLKRKFREIIISKMKADSKNADVYLRVHSFVRQLERIGDMATNICEDVIYIVSGKIVRHHVATDGLESEDSEYGQ